MKKMILVTTMLLVILLASCKPDEELDYLCNTDDGVFVPFHDREDLNFFNIDLNKLNQCNEELDTLDSATEKIGQIYYKLSLKTEALDPDLTAYEEYNEYESNHRLYKEDLVTYDIFDTYSDTIELSYIIETFLNVGEIIQFYEEPEEGKLNNLKNSDEFYKLRYYVNDDYMYYVQYHTESGSQFTVSRIYFDENNKVYFDELKYFAEDVHVTYQYTAYQEGVGGFRTQYQEYDKYRGILDVQWADFEQGIITEVRFSNYASKILKYRIIDREEQQITHLYRDAALESQSTEIYDNNVFVYGLSSATEEQVTTTDFRANLMYINGWDYYFQQGLYKDETLITFDKPIAIFKNTAINSEDYVDIHQHFELVVHNPVMVTTGPQTTVSIPGELTLDGITFDTLMNMYDSQTETILFNIDAMLDNQDFEEDVELLKIWEQFVPKEFSDFIDKN